MANTVDFQGEFITAEYGRHGQQLHRGKNLVLHLQVRTKSGSGACFYQHRFEYGTCAPIAVRDFV